MLKNDFHKTYNYEKLNICNTFLKDIVMVEKIYSTLPYTYTSYKSY